MDLKKLYQDDDAVSPVIGVILMVAITVILAAVIASFVLNLGGETSTTPQVSFDFEFSENSTTSNWNSGNDSDLVDRDDEATGGLTITHNSGDSIQADRLTIRDEDGGERDATDEFTGDEISSGDNAEIVIDSDDTIRLIYTNDDGEDSTTLATWEAPDA